MKSTGFESHSEIHGLLRLASGPHVIWRVAVRCSVVQSGAISYKSSCCLSALDSSPLDNAECCSVLQCVAVCCRVLQSVAECCSVLQCLAVSCSVLQCLAVSCNVLQGDAVCAECCHFLEVFLLLVGFRLIAIR